VAYRGVFSAQSREKDSTTRSEEQHDHRIHTLKRLRSPSTSGLSITRKSQYIPLVAFVTKCKLLADGPIR
jgi:hypothetical protein